MPRELSLARLPIVLHPGAVRPLHIVEPRHRAGAPPPPLAAQAAAQAGTRKRRQSQSGLLPQIEGMGP